PTPPTALYPLSLHDALPICRLRRKTEIESFFIHHSNTPLLQFSHSVLPLLQLENLFPLLIRLPPHLFRKITGLGVLIFPMVWLADRKSTRLNSSHDQISYAV